MTFRQLTELLEKSRNADHTSVIMSIEEMYGSNQLDHGWGWITAGDGW